MSWPSKLAETYDKCTEYIDYANEYKGKGLLPLYHVYFRASIEVVLNTKGDFLSASRVDKEDEVTIGPAPADYLNKSVGESPWGLDDKLEYLAGDYQNDNEKSMHRHKAYMNQLKKWIDDGAPVAVEAIYKYLSKARLVKDLKDTDVFNEKSNKEFVRFIVIDQTNQERCCVWRNREIIQSFITHQRYIQNEERNKGIDYLTGENDVPLMRLAPAKILSSGDTAKIISENTSNQFTYVGRYKEVDQVRQIGIESVQKVHFAFSWLIARQGHVKDTEAIVCWTANVKKSQGLIDDISSELLGNDVEVETSKGFANEVNKAIEGYPKEIDPNQTVNVIGLDKQSKGRLSITMYYEIQSKQFLENIALWYNTCKWNLFSNKEFTLSLNNIIYCAYGGTFGDGFKQDNGINVKLKLYTKAKSRLVPCIIQKRKIPKDIVHTAVINVSQPYRFKYDENDKKNKSKISWILNWKKYICICCAIVHKYQCDYMDGEEVYEMALNETTTDRNYLFGRLLAVSEKIEEIAQYYKSKESGGEKVKVRETNTLKYWTTYTMRPAKTWSVVESRLLPYISYLKSKHSYLEDSYSQIIEQVVDLLEQGNGFTNEPLNENYLLGYYSQKAAFRKDMEDNKDE